VLEFEIEPRASRGSQTSDAPSSGPDVSGSVVKVSAYWHPKGVWGLLYWYALVPAHGFLFKRFTRAMARRAEALEAAIP
jgi:Protein of unknown function (DUF2867)